MEILFSDQNILICVKPVGLDSEQELPNELKKQLPGEIYPIHRLDKNVGGVMVYARTKKAAAEFSQMVKNGDLVKEYVAQVHGELPESGVWTDLLFKDSRKNKVFVVDKPRKGVKEAKLEFRRLSESVALIRLYTGRSHQIRVQFASRGFPLVGDHKYGSRSEKTEPMLFSCRLTFPYHGAVRTFSARPDWIFEDF
jgi:23S rRNA pseudouridine1911/1915/1917 synthase